MQSFFPPLLLFIILMNEPSSERTKHLKIRNIVSHSHHQQYQCYGKNVYVHAYCLCLCACEVIALKSRFTISNNDNN